ncbi:MAG: UDP-N-acetylmuramoyl-tripeptide--D-alanyl-D-alanine ligase [Alphaproteobacteria bacterium]|nr:UDP-N-acetylmuramoyl-tripeptide--D-alanyl-D-alanine ligase [Alphaproteobacteria bacterium]
MFLDGLYLLHPVWPYILVFLAYLFFAYRRILIYLHALQQEDYDNQRLVRWIIENRVFDKKLSAVFIGLWLGSFILDWLPTILLCICALAYFTWKENDPRKAAKKKLVMTQRAKRIAFPALLMAAGAGLLIYSPLTCLIAVQFVPVFLVLSNLILVPYEKAVQHKFYSEAQKKLEECNPVIIGITGSYGKTSVKHILGHVLKSIAPTLITPGSVNTVMGITRVIREQLEPNHKYFVVEMGAYGPGSIERLCALTPPNVGIITAIGHAHYERFKTLDTVAHAKYELAQAVLAKSGTVVVNEKTLDFTHTRAMKENNASHFVVCGEDNSSCDLTILKVSQDREGLQIQINWKGTEYTLAAPLFGLHHGHNIALAFAAAVSLGAAPADVQAALKSVPQIKHRLEVKPQGGETILIDDAYNSNPEGFRAALDLLPVLRGENGRSILVTPGIVELGEAHESVHHELGAHAAKTCDVVLVVNAARISSFISGFKEAGTGNPILPFDTFAEADNWLMLNRKAGDVVLLENDLPDLYEGVPKL